MTSQYEIDLKKEILSLRRENDELETYLRRTVASLLVLRAGIEKKGVDDRLIKEVTNYLEKKR